MLRGYGEGQLHRLIDVLHIRLMLYAVRKVMRDVQERTM